MVFLLSQIDLDSRHMGWVTSELPGGDHHVIKIELKGPENTLRVRQVKVLGWKEGDSIKIAGQISASVAQQKNCEAETLRVFRLITSQVSPKPSQVLFGKPAPAILNRISDPLYNSSTYLILYLRLD